MEKLLAIITAIEAVKEQMQSYSQQVRTDSLNKSYQLLCEVQSDVALGYSNMVKKCTMQNSNFSLTWEEQEMVRNPTRKIEAIKAYRGRTGLGLKASKEAIEDWMEKNLGFRHYNS